MTPTIHLVRTDNTSSSFHIYFDTPKQLTKIVTIKSKETEFSGKKDEMLHIEQISENYIIHSVILGFEVKTVRNQIVKAVQLARSCKAETISVHLPKNHDFIRSVGEGIILGDYSFDRFKNKEYTKKHPHVRDVYIVGEFSNGDKEQLNRGVHSAEAQILTRDLVNMPGGHIYPEILAEYAERIGKQSNGAVDVTVLSEEECKKRGMGSFLSVGQGSEKKSSFIILHYKGAGTKKYAFVGKSITFDSGGLSLKPGEHMMDMKIDMAGGAAVLGVFQYLATERPNLSSFSDIYGILPAAENMVSGKATKPGDIVQAMNGKTIEILNTDAEGRLVLADALVYADTVLKADYIIDMATLTGACMVALGTDLAGLFTTDDDFEKSFKEAAIRAGEEYWKLPLYTPYLALMKSSIADLKNIGGGRYGGAITAAVFLKEFVKNAKWIHIDIAGPAHSDKKGASGWGVLSVIYFLEFVKNI